jgi:two-component system chemotaxis response regulator CheY
MAYSEFDFSQLGVMIVDDNRHMRALLCSIMHALGIKRVKEVADGETALKVIDEFKPELVITDWHMEPMNGIDLVRRLRKSGDEATRYVSIIMLTGHSELARVHEARDAGIHEFLAKPISAKSLFTRIATIIENPRPFIKTDAYFGPDRRRQDIGPPPGVVDRRVGSDADDVPATMSEAQVEELLTS